MKNVPELKHIFEKAFCFSLNKNQFKDIERLTKEICRRDMCDATAVIEILKAQSNINTAHGKNKFTLIKDSLIRMRFPLTSAREAIDKKTIFLSPWQNPLPREHEEGGSGFKPEEIFIEKKALASALAKRVTEMFHDAKIEEINSHAEYIQTHGFNTRDLKKAVLFIVNEQWDFIKPCPCTKGRLGCNYWIFNGGFGCPFDCSYCFLQHYTNSPGIILPANLDDFFSRFDDWFKKIRRPIRIGTGEFCDSLALDDITGQASQLIDFFKNKPVYFELKTKSNAVGNILAHGPAPNIVISWSLNPDYLIESEEKNAASLSQRLEAARKVQKGGFSLAFHFDPIIYTDDWKNLYRKTIETLYRKVPGPFRWISLGTLRGSRSLKKIAETRFAHSKIFYGELFLGYDKKLRYPEFLRREIYASMHEWIRSHDPDTPVYLCMEDARMWQTIYKKPVSTPEIEQYLLKDFPR